MTESRVVGVETVGPTGSPTHRLDQAYPNLVCLNDYLYLVYSYWKTSRK